MGGINFVKILFGKGGWVVLFVNKEKLLQNIDCICFISCQTGQTKGTNKQCNKHS